MSQVHLDPFSRASGRFIQHQGDICPGDLEPVSKVFLIVFAFSSLGFFCGPILELASSWKHHVPSGGFAMLASLAVGLGVTLFTTFEGASQSEAVYASIIAGELRCLCRFSRILYSLQIVRSNFIFGCPRG